MKKIFSIFLLMAVMAVSSICYADISPSEVSLGGISPGTSKDYLVSVYGQPDDILYGKYGVETYVYGGTFSIRFGGTSPSAIWVETMGNNGIGTPSGITVGMRESELTIYGIPQTIDYEDGVKIIRFWAPGRKALDFSVINGIITHIKAVA